MLIRRGHTTEVSWLYALSCDLLSYALPLPHYVVAVLLAVLDTAYKSSQYLSSLLDHGLIKPDPSVELDKLYASFTSSSRISQSFPPLTLASRPSEKKSTIGNVVADGKSEAASGTGSSQSECILLIRKAMPHIPQNVPSSRIRISTYVSCHGPSTRTPRCIVIIRLFMKASY
ncbi:hypothetical protein J3R82DRAFT_9700 [Butyriboletus roseoflavus]|nr:hypothetical protein J3R82DRAFT_9700 [Butyriboletus roseoflavus]